MRIKHINQYIMIGAYSLHKTIIRRVNNYYYDRGLLCILYSAHSAIAKARENVISDAISDSTGSFKITTPTSGGTVQPTTQHPSPEKKGQRSPAHASQQRTVTVTLKDAPITKVDDIMMM